MEKRGRRLRITRTCSSQIRLQPLHISQQGRQQLVVGELFHGLALEEDQPAVLAAGNADVGLPGLAGTVDHAAHDRHGDGLFAVLEGLLDPAGQADQVNLRPPAGRAGDDVDAVLAQAGGLQNCLGRDHLADRVGGQRDADRIPDAHAEQAADAHGRFDRPHIFCASLGHAEMEGIVRLGGKEAVGRHHQRHRGGLHGKAGIVEAVFFQQAQVAEGGFHQGLRGGVAVFFQQLLDIYDEKLARYGIPIMRARSSVCSSFSAIFPDIYNNVSLEDRGIQIKYRPSWSESESYDDIMIRLANQRDVDIKMSTTTSGPHRDRFLITDRNGVFVNGASTGQMRLASLVFRSAQAAFYRQKTGLNPIFLIDDVLLELDSQKRARYLSYLGHYNQAFFTFLPEEKYFGAFFNPNGSDTIRYRVENGRFLSA